MASYATTADLAQYAINSAAFASVAAGTQQTQLDAASTLAEGYLADQYHLPIIAPFPIDLKLAVCNIAAYFLMTFRGYRPDGSDEIVRQRYEDAMSWLRDVANGTTSPAGIIDSTPTVRDGAPVVTTGTMANVVGGYGAPTITATGQKVYPYTGTVPGRRGW